jgi:hypothetical protein
MCECSLRKVIYSEYLDTYKAREASNTGSGEQQQELPRGAAPASAAVWEMYYKSPCEA